MVPIAETDDPEALDRWSFALGALDIFFELTSSDDDATTVVLWVRPEHAADAHRTVVELDLEASEPTPAALSEAAARRSKAAVYRNALPWTLAYLWAVTLISLGGLAGWGWTLRGRMDATLLFAGEWFRSLTAITLHADLGHLLSNGMLCGIVGTAAVARTGPGVTAIVAVAAGAFANVASAALHGEGFRSLGASGAVFALLGLVAAVAVRTSPRTGARRWLPGVGAAAALFAWMGVAPGSDVLAHFFGCAFGFGAGLAVPLADSFSKAVNLRLQQVTGALAGSALALAWAFAFLSSPS